MQIEPPGGQIVARAARAKRPGNAPVLAVQLDQLAAHGQPRQLLQQQTPLPSAAQRQLAHQLLVSGLPAGRAGNPRQQFLVGHSLRVGHRRRSRQCLGWPVYFEDLALRDLLGTLAFFSGP